jgi:hypothetical protein
MTVSRQKWITWLDSLEDILHEADIAGENIFAILIDSAINQAHTQLGTERGNPKADQPIKDDTIS